MCTLGVSSPSSTVNALTTSLCWAALSRAAAELGWRAQVGFEEGLRRTISWYRDHRGYRASYDPSRAGIEGPPS